MKKLTKIFVMCIAAMLVVLSMAGCGSSKSANYYDAAREDYYEADYEVPASAEYEADEAGYGYYASEQKSENSYSDDAMPQETEPASPELPEALTDAKLVYTAYTAIETTDFDTTIASIKERVQKAGGYIENSSLSDYGRYRYMSYVLRIPSEQYRYFCDTISEIGHIKNFNENVSNISESYYDTVSRLESAKAKMATLNELMKKAETMEDIITIQAAISDCQWDIDYYSGNLRHFDSLVKFSTVNMEISEVSRLSNTEEPAIGFGQEVTRAFKNGWKNFVNGVQDFIVGFANNFVGWGIFIAIVIVVIIVVKKLLKKSKAKRAAEAAAYEQQRKTFREMSQSQHTMQVPPAPQPPVTKEEGK